MVERFPPLALDEVVARIRAFEGTDGAGQRDTIRRFVSAHPVLCYEWGGSWRYRRVRAIDPEHRPNHVAELIWRADAPAALGRANAAGFTVLYLADRRDTAISETRTEEGDVVLTEFTIRPGRSMRVAPIGEMAQIQRTGRGHLAGDASASINDLLNACDLQGCRSMLLVDAFLFECLTNREDDYERSSAVAMAIYDKLPDLHAVAFSSRRQSGAINFAVRADRVWEAWGIVSVREAHARHLAMGYYELSGVRHVNGITTAGDLMWDEVIEENEQAIALLDPPWYPTNYSDQG